MVRCLQVRHYQFFNFKDYHYFFFLEIILLPSALVGYISLTATNDYQEIAKANSKGCRKKIYHAGIAHKCNDVMVGLQTKGSSNERPSKRQNNSARCLRDRARCKATMSRAS